MSPAPGVVVLGVVAVACGLVALDSAASSDAASTPTAAAAPQSPPGEDDALANPANNEVGKAVLDANGYGAPAETASMSCASKTTCDLVFIPPSKDAVRPFGLTVKLVRANAKQVVISVAGKRYVVEPGKAVKVAGATIKLVGTPGSVVTLNIRSA